MHDFMPHLDRLIDLALTEDIGGGDMTTQATVPPSQQGHAELCAKEPLVLAGSAVFSRVFARLDGGVQVQWHFRDGDELPKGAVAARLDGPMQALLSGERLALNFAMHLSGIATSTRRLLASMKKYPHVALLDTRKTTPGMRELEKQAVAVGGGTNHRHGLFDGVLIKDNHIRAAGSVTEAVRRARSFAHHLLKVECEVTTMAELDEALAAGADSILLDNMDDALTAQAVQRIRSAGRPIFIEASGNMSAERLPRVAALGVDGISMGALTHSVRAVDLSLEIVVDSDAGGGPARAQRVGTHGGG